MLGGRTSAKLKVTSSEEEIELFFARFYERFPTEADCEETIFRAASPDGIRCECGLLVLNRKCGERTARCTSCKKTVSATANTFFHGMKRPTAYCGAIFVLGEGLAISANEFSKRVGVASSAGAVILHEVSSVIVDIMNDAREMLSAVLLKPVGKRSKETPAREHPKMEQAEAEKRAAGNEGNKPVSSVNPGVLLQRMSESAQTKIPENEVQKRIYDLLSANPLSLEVLSDKSNLPHSELMCSLTMLELSGMVKQLPGNRFEAIEIKIAHVLKQPMLLAGAQDTEAKLFFQFVSKTFHAVSRKYLQRYLARYWCFIDRVRWSFESLLDVCAKAGPKSYEQLSGYVTPLSVKAVLAR